ncbi:MAG TPA: DNA mismatch repair protein MutS, partial [Clostridia bacterium]|nr:DNA mismatch repair protein MutS [Clostridia bacterium]
QGVKNYCVDVLKKGDDIVFLRKLKRGGADGSYGIEVAQLAGIPQAVTLRAKELLAILEEQDISRKEIRRIKRRNKEGEGQVDLVTYAANTVMRDEIVEELKNLDVQTITPIEALNVLFNLHQKAMKRK